MSIEDDDEEIVVYYVKVFISHDNIFRSRTFSIPDAEDVLEYFFYDRLSDQQADLSKYHIKKIAKFKDTEQFAIALKGYEYLERYSS